MDFYAFQFTDGDKVLAKKIIEVKAEIGRKDLGTLTYFIGAISVLVPLTIFFIYT